MPSRCRVVVALLLGLSGCRRGSSTSADAGSSAVEEASAQTSPSGNAVARAEDLRRAREVPAEARTSHDAAVRRTSARALARIADAASVEGLVAHLADEDAEVASWAAYGLGQACKGREDAHVKMLAARAASFGAAGGPARSAVRGPPEIELRASLARAIGRCGGGIAEQALLALLKTGGAWQEPSLLGLGDLARGGKSMGAEALTALLEAASATPARAPQDLAFYALSRTDPGEAFGTRVVEAARAALARPGDARIMAVKALGRAGKESPKEVAPDLLRVVLDAQGFTVAERAEAARALSALAEPGRLAAADALARLAPDRDPAQIQALLGPEFHVLHAVLEALSADPPRKVEPALRALAALAAPAAPAPALARRLAELRCGAALGLARGIHDAEVLRRCDVESSETSQRARLTSLLRRPLTGERRAAFRAFARSEHLRVREQAVEAIGQHPELGDVAASVLAEALGSKKAGLVATAAEVIDQHPDRAQVLAEREKRAALDPRAPPPSANPAQELSREVAEALSSALAERWPEDRFETRIALLEAAAAVRHPQAKAVATAACSDPNVTVRERAHKALRALGESVAACAAESGPGEPAAEVGRSRRTPTKLVFMTDDADRGPLTLVLEPDLSPVTVTRLTALARAGFYKDVKVHRVVPGFVVQFGDPDGDGYGGAGTSLRCETSPVPFAPLDVGMALSGRDTGSSQLFVTLSRTPHLDGEYARVGRAEGPWSSLAQGDVFVDVKVVE